MSESEQKIGYYFEFKRGSWMQYGEREVERFPASGLSYVGDLTEVQMKELDKLISDYLERRALSPSEPAIRERGGGNG